MSKINKTIASILFCLLASIPAISSAAEDVKPRLKEFNELNPWTDCGLGAMIFDNTSWAAAISNVIWDLGTTAVTSAASSAQTCSGKNAKVAMLIGTTYANLEEETVKGNGQNLNAMLNIMNCDPAARQNIISSIRSTFVQSLRDASYTDKTSQVKAEEYYNLVQAKAAGEFAHQCQAI